MCGGILWPLLFVLCTGLQKTRLGLVVWSCLSLICCFSGGPMFQLFAVDVLPCEVVRAIAKMRCRNQRSDALHRMMTLCLVVQRAYPYDSRTYRAADNLWWALSAVSTFDYARYRPRLRRSVRKAA